MTIIESTITRRSSLFLGQRRASSYINGMSSSSSSVPISFLNNNTIRRPRRPLLFLQQQTRKNNADSIKSNTDSSSRRRNSSSSSSSSNNNKKKNSNRPQVSMPGKNNTDRNTNLNRVWYTPPSSSSGGTKSLPSPLTLEMGRYGLKRLNYYGTGGSSGSSSSTSNGGTILIKDPPLWQTPPHPPTKTIKERIVFPLTLIIVAGVIIWAYLTPENDDMTDYWKRVESGQILFDDDDDDDGDDDDDDDDDDDFIKDI